MLLTFERQKTLKYTSWHVRVPVIPVQIEFATKDDTRACLRNLLTVVMRLF